MGEAFDSTRQPLTFGGLLLDLDGTLVDTAPDMVRVLDYLFKATFVPPAPFPEGGVDPTADALNCDVGLE